VGTKKKLTALILTAALATPALANEAIRSGGFEIRTRAAVAHETLTWKDEDQGTRTDADVDLFCGLFLASWVELGVGGTYNYTKVDPEQGTSTDRSSFGVLPSLVLNLAPSASVVPYVGAGGGVAFYNGDYAGDESATILPRVEAGLRFFVAEGASLNLSAVYAHWTNLDGEEDAEADRFTVGLGISIYP